MNAEKTADLNETPDVSKFVHHMKLVRARFYWPGGPPLTAKMQKARREPWLFLQSSRFVNWVVRPGLLLLVGMATWYARPFGIGLELLMSVLGPMMYLFVAQMWQVWVVWCSVVVQLAPHAGDVALMNRQQRQQWYGRVRRWFEVNRLAGPNANRWLWDKASREKFARTYNAAVRRATGQSHPRLKEEMPDEERRGYDELRSVMEECPLCTEMMFYENNLLLLMAKLGTEGFLAASLASWLSRAL